MHERIDHEGDNSLASKIRKSQQNSEINTNTDTPIQHGVPLDDYKECKDLKPSALGMSPEY